MMWRICYQYLLALGLLAGILPVTQAADDPTETFLYEQVRLGNSKSNDVLVSQSLYRLSLIKPNDPSVVNAYPICCKTKRNSKSTTTG